MNENRKVPLIKRPHIKYIFTIIPILVLCCSFCNGDDISNISKKLTKGLIEDKYAEQQDTSVAPPPQPLEIFELTEIARTTADAEPHFLRMKIALAFEKNAALNSELISKNNQILNIVSLVLMGKKYKDLDSVSSAVELSEELKAHINVILTTGKIKEIYFQKFKLD